MKPPTIVEPTASIVPRIAQEIIDKILDHLASNSDLQTLRSCSLVTKSWVGRCQLHLFHTIHFTLKDMKKWLETFPVPEESPARHVRALRVALRRSDHVPLAFFEYIPWFSNAEEITLSGNGGFSRMWIPPIVRLSQSVTTLTVDTDDVTLAQLRDVVSQLPNLDNLSLWGTLLWADRSASPGVGTSLRGRFRGQLRLLKGCAYTGVTDMLLQVPTGLHFTGIEVRCRYESLLSTVRLAEACGKSLVKLAYLVSTYDGREPFERTFNCSMFPNLQEVRLGVRWVSGNLRWISTALSTLKPTTSPHLSTVQLSFSGRTTVTQDEEIAGDLQLIGTEISRIRREFEGAVRLTVIQNGWFQAALEELDMEHRLRGTDDAS